MVRKPVFFGAVICLICSAPLSGGHFRTPGPPQHFFLPSRTLFFFRPDLYVRLHSYPVPALYAPAIHSQQTTAYSKRVYRVGLSGFTPSEMVRANSSDLIFQVNPPKALVYIDGSLIGSAGDFATQKKGYPIVDGHHVLRIEFPGYQTFKTRMEVVANRTLNLRVELEPAAP